eukprot:GHVP01012375.1.p2 GENE.GHVP01012375.1~~GHVP01012375.1.p2  ORF type:complete len:174 (+),score=10.28 GHVP01012375.1:820-1341(+)
MFPSVTYLGHNISALGVQPETNRVKAFLKGKSPNSKEELRLLYGSLSYFRRFLPHFSERTAGMTELLKKNALFLWSPEMEADLRLLLLDLSCATILSAPNFSLPFILMTDASDKAVGAVLAQIQDDCASLEVLRTASNGRLLRWALYFQQFNLSIHHVSGKVNCISDWMSRSV